MPNEQGDGLRRREFLGLGAGAAAAWPVTAWGEHASPTIGFLNAASSDSYAERLRGFRQGLKETGFVENENVAVEYRWADNQNARLEAMATELVRRRVALIAATGGNAAVQAAKSATTTIPIVFVTPDDPVKLGLVTSMARPNGNLTGVNFVGTELGAKRLELLREIVPATSRVAVIWNPAEPSSEIRMNEVRSAASALGIQIQVYNASNSHEIDVAFAAMLPERPDALLFMPDPAFNGRRIQLVHLASRHAIPAIYWQREFTEVGGLISYGSSIGDAFRQLGVYAGRVLKGDKIADLPVVRSDKFELVINHQAARLLGINVPPSLLARADEVIE
jgi:putative tryptophan/tyrosine transport system substrate-binding protein